jgi:uncharacterized protein YxeA
MKRIIITVLAIMFLVGCAHFEQPSNLKDGHFTKYDQYQAEKETGNFNGR